MPYADGFDYFKVYGNVGWKYTPLICIVDVRPELKYYTIRAVDSWEREFNKHDIYDYDYRIKLTDKQEIDCNAVITFGNVNEVWKNSGTNVGIAQCYETYKTSVTNNTGGKSTLIADVFCKAMINPDFEAGSYYYNTVVHETGHVLGLGHRLPIEVKSYLYVVLTDDIMQPQASLFKEITIESLDALQYIYGYNGWNGIVNGNYTVPHIINE